MATKKSVLATKPVRAPDRIEPLILRMRGQRVVLDADLAQLYGVKTIVFNQAIKRNRERFPDDFAFRLTALEVSSLKSHSVISSSQIYDHKKNSANTSQSVISSHRGRRYLPWAFTEHGALMAANVLRSEHAVQNSFVRTIPMAAFRPLIQWRCGLWSKIGSI